MALLALDDLEFGPNGTDHHVYAAQSSPASGVYVTAASKKKDGSYGYEIAGNDEYVTYGIPASAEIYLSVFLVPNGSNTGRNIKWGSSGTELGSLRWTSTLYHVHLGTSGTSSADGTTVVPALGSGGAMKNYQLRIKIGNTTTGSIQFKLEDTMEINYDAQDTQPGSETTINEISFGNQVVIDNIWINDTTTAVNNSWPGIVRMYTDAPIGDSAAAERNEWTGTSPGTKADLVNTTLDPDVYVYSDTVGQVQGFSYPAPCVPPGSTIKSISIIDLPYKVSSGSLIQGIRVGSSNYTSSSKALNTGVFTGSARAQHFEVNPAGGGAWVTTDNPESYLEHSA